MEIYLNNSLLKGNMTQGKLDTWREITGLELRKTKKDSLALNVTIFFCIKAWKPGINAHFKLLFSEFFEARCHLLEVIFPPSQVAKIISALPRYFVTPFSPHQAPHPTPLLTSHVWHLYSWQAFGRTNTLNWIYLERYLHRQLIGWSQILPPDTRVLPPDTRVYVARHSRETSSISVRVHLYLFLSVFVYCWYR